MEVLTKIEIKLSEPFRSILILYILIHQNIYKDVTKWKECLFFWGVDKTLQFKVPVMCVCIFIYTHIKVRKDINYKMFHDPSISSNSIIAALSLLQ